MYDSVIELVKRVATISDETGIVTVRGNYVETRAGRQLMTDDGRPVRAASPVVTQVAYAEVESISRDEWQAAGAEGLNPGFRFRMPRSSYSGEAALIYGGRMYAIYRTYEKHGEIELYTHIEAGETYVG